MRIVTTTDATEKGEPVDKPAAVQGWACGSDDAPVIVNPSASKQALLTWGVAQLQQVNVMLSIIGAARHDAIYSPDEVCGAVRHFTEQAEAVLGEALRRD